MGLGDFIGMGDPVIKAVMNFISCLNEKKNNDNKLDFNEVVECFVALVLAILPLMVSDSKKKKK